MKDIPATGISRTRAEIAEPRTSSPAEIAGIEARARAMRAACLHSLARDLMARIKGIKSAQGRSPGRLEHAV